MNALIGFSALAAWFILRRRSAAEVNDTAVNEPTSGACALPFSAGIVLAALSGFIALGYEIVWYRVFSWASGTNPKTFAFMLGAYLAGLALGALAVEGRCRSHRAGFDHLWYAAVMLVGGNILAALVPPIFSSAVLVMSWDRAQLLAMVALACATAMLGTTFPLVCHLTVRPDSSAGQGLSILYVANIVGSASGSFVAGYVLTEMFTLPGICTLFATAGHCAGLGPDGQSRRSPCALRAFGRAGRSLRAGAGRAHVSPDLRASVHQSEDATVCACRREPPWRHRGIPR